MVSLAIAAYCSLSRAGQSESQRVMRVARAFIYRLYFIYARKANYSLRPYTRKNYATVEIHL